MREVSSQRSKVARLRFIVPVVQKPEDTLMFDRRKFYIDGQWVDPAQANDHEVMNPATMEPAGVVTLGSEADVNAAVAAARRAFDSWSVTSREERMAILEKAIGLYMERSEEVAKTITSEMGAPLEAVSKPLQSQVPIGHFANTLEVLKNYEFEEPLGATTVVRDPAGVCALVTPWNWPAHQVASKVAPALAAGCTMVLKPSEFTPFDAHILAEILHDAGVPAGVFNLVVGDGPSVGAKLTSHPEIDLASFTGSTRAGQMIYESGAKTMKRLSLELGGKSPNIILEDADLQAAITHGIQALMLNSGQNCSSPSRMLVPASKIGEIEEIAREIAGAIVVGDPLDPATTMGPVANKPHFNRVRGYIESGSKGGAKLVCGGPELPPGIDRGCFVKPTVFSRVDNNMTIAQEEIFGPVLCIIPYKDEDEAIRIAHDTIYGLAAYVFGSDMDRLRKLARRLRAGNVHINGAMQDIRAPFGGYKMSGLGRELGVHGFEEFLEIKAVLNDQPSKADVAAF
jgi:acyl-CoA reductase-like NAD-dependent aldehyde dehydrogenase